MIKDDAGRCQVEQKKSGKRARKTKESQKALEIPQASPPVKARIMKNTQSKSRRRSELLDRRSEVEEASMPRRSV